MVYTGSDTLQDRYLSDNDAGSVLGNFWTVSNYVAGNTDVTYSMTRSNNIGGSCAQCYVFDVDADTLNIIMARGKASDGTTLAQHGASGGQGSNARPYTLTAVTTTTTTTSPPVTTTHFIASNVFTDYEFQIDIASDRTTVQLNHSRLTANTFTIR